ncbi:ubiquitin-like-conjugating enzyme ATG10 [Pieris napi]|uniref:ubiquitin-like-conjugating enzyme ATG10 n=1 Tax=Pieris napi TaxID=78633 RepID=UPI001FBA88A3|nr:ubiquitin-like-conjugating enzyme ATG10 [Pieris napi]
MAYELTAEGFLSSAKAFIETSNLLHDDWKLYENSDICKSYIRKNTFIDVKGQLFKAEFVIFYHLSYGVPSFSFNIWDSSGMLLNLEDIRKISFTKINQKDFYSVITQQEHPVLCRPFFIMHPCHTYQLLSSLRESKNIIVTFLGLITPLINLQLSLKYGL